MYRFTGIKERRATKVQIGECCEPFCGPSTCGTSTLEDPKTESGGVKVEATSQCCEPLRGQETCG